MHRNNSRVVIGHTALPTGIPKKIFPIYSYHMVLFIFISGYFYKPENEKTF